MAKGEFFMVEYGLRIENERITSAYSNCRATGEEIRDFIQEEGCYFAVDAWRVRSRYESTRKAHELIIEFVEDEEVRYTRYIPLGRNGTLLLGCDQITSKPRVRFLRDDSATTLCQDFGLTSIINGNPNDSYVADWSWMNFDGDFEMAEVITDGVVTKSVPEDERLGYRGEIKFVVKDATWVVFCQKSYSDSHRQCSYELYTELSNSAAVKALRSYLDEHDMGSPADVFDMWEVE